MLTTLLQELHAEYADEHSRAELVAITIGAPPTAPKARAGLLTPPGIIA